MAELDIQPGHVEASSGALDIQEGHVEEEPGVIRKTFDALTYPVRHPVDFAAKEGLTMAGAGAGAAAGAEAAAPAALAAGPIAGPLIELGAAGMGAYAGGFGGRVAQSGAEKVGNILGAGNPPESAAETLLKANEAGQNMAEGEIIGRPVGTAVGKAAQKVWGKVKPAVSEAISNSTARGIKAAQDLGIPLTYGQISQSKMALAFEGFMRNSPVFGDLIASKDMAATKALGEARQDLLATLGPKQSLEGLGTAAKQEMTENLTGAEASRLKRYGLDRKSASSAFPAPELPEARRVGMEQDARLAEAKALARRTRLYEMADQAHAPGALLDLDRLQIEGKSITGDYSKQGAENLRGQAYATAASYANPALPKVLKGVPPEVMAFVKANPELTPPVGSGPNGALTMKEAPQAAIFQQAKQLNPEQIEAIKSQGKMNVLQLQNEINLLGGKANSPENKYSQGSYSPEGKQYLRMQSAAQDILDAHFQDAAPEAKRLYRLADTFHGAYAETYRNSTLRGIYGENPSKTFLSVAQGGSDVEMKRLSRALGPDGNKILLRELFDQVFGEGDRIPTEEEVTKRISKFGPAMRALMSEQDQKSWKNFAVKGALDKKSGAAVAFLQSKYDIAAKGLINGEPHKLSENILSGNTMLAVSAKKYLPASTWKAFGRQLAENITTAAPGQAIEEGFSGVRKRLESFEPKYLREFFSPKVVEGMMKIGDSTQILPSYGDLSQKAASSAGSGSRGAMMMAGMVMYHLGSPKKVAMTLLTAPMVGELYTSEMGQKFLTTLMRMPPDDPRVGRLVQQAIGYLGRTVITDPKVKQMLGSK